MIDRIKKLMEWKKLTATQFSDEIGIQRSSLSHIVSGRNKPSLDFVMKVKMRFSEINFDWLLLGNGQMIESNENSILPDGQNKIESSEVDEQNEIPFISANEPPISRIGKQAVTIDPSTHEHIERKIMEDQNPERIILVYADNSYEILTPKK